MTRKLCFTADVDRDVNICIPGRIAAASMRTDDNRARFTSSEEGVNILLDMLDDIGITATFFTEARTLENIDVQFGNNEVAMHGLDHEDMTGELSGVRISGEMISELMQRSSDIIRDRTGRAAKGFRAPYMRTNIEVMKMLPRFGIVYDSSMYAPIGAAAPYDTENGIKEVPVPESTDANGKRITGYLWPMHENVRGPDEFIRMAGEVRNGIFVLATHSWHMVESRSGGMMDAARREMNINDVRKTITSLLDSGFKAARMTDTI
ncbi:MAG: polysaccharide deacetylase family protein [Methanomassiliicoccaceae archaeon]|jgi:peptidoglycan/xylan/chitin deacetylase (PgdA/CDA1 family)|nr:polysaccharide deacetylase family protein [Methanomassiliicoccaceae archaeon]